MFAIYILHVQLLYDAAVPFKMSFILFVIYICTANWSLCSFSYLKRRIPVSWSDVLSQDSWPIGVIECAESIATLHPFGPIVGHNWFFQISSQWEPQKNWSALISFSKFQFWPPCIWGGTTWKGDLKCRDVKIGFCRMRWMQTGSSETLIGWKSGKTTYVPQWDRTEGAWLWTLRSPVQCVPPQKKPKPLEEF